MSLTSLTADFTFLLSEVAFDSFEISATIPISCLCSGVSFSSSWYSLTNSSCPGPCFDSWSFLTLEEPLPGAKTSLWSFLELYLLFYRCSASRSDGSSARSASEVGPTFAFVSDGARLDFFLHIFLTRSQPGGTTSPSLCSINSPFSGFLRKVLATGDFDWKDERSPFDDCCWFTDWASDDFNPSWSGLEPTSWLPTESLRLWLLFCPWCFDLASFSLVLKLPFSWSISLGNTWACFFMVLYLRNGFPYTSLEPSDMSVWHPAKAILSCKNSKSCVCVPYSYFQSLLYFFSNSAISLWSSSFACTSFWFFSWDTYSCPIKSTIYSPRIALSRYISSLYLFSISSCYLISAIIFICLANSSLFSLISFRRASAVSFDHYFYIKKAT